MEIKKIIPTYPQVLVTSTQFDNKRKRIVCETLLRKKQEGNWYISLFRKSQERPSDNLAHIEEVDVTYFLNTFHAEIYRHLICMVIDTNLKMLDGTDIFIIDNDQRDEQERLNF